MTNATVNVLYQNFEEALVSVLIGNKGWLRVVMRCGRRALLPFLTPNATRRDSIR
jgi:hypothetical protein